MSDPNDKREKDSTDRIDGLKFTINIGLFLITVLLTTNCVRLSRDAAFDKNDLLTKENLLLKDENDKLRDELAYLTADVEEQLRRNNRMWQDRMLDKHDEIRNQLLAGWNASMAPDACLEEKYFDTCIGKTPHIHGLFTTSADIIRECKAQAFTLSQRRRDTIKKECQRAE